MDEGVSANAIKEITPTHIQKLVQAVRACGYESKNVIAISVEKNEHDKQSTSYYTVEE